VPWFESAVPTATMTGIDVFHWSAHGSQQIWISTPHSEIHHNVCLQTFVLAEQKSQSEFSLSKS